MLQEHQARVPMVREAGSVVLSQKVVPVPEHEAVVHVLYGLLAFPLLLPMYVDTPYFCSLVVAVNHCAALQLQLGLELELDRELELGVEWPERPGPLEPLGLLGWLVELVEHLGEVELDAQQALG